VRLKGCNRWAVERVAVEMDLAVGLVVTPVMEEERLAVRMAVAETGVDAEVGTVMVAVAMAEAIKAMVVVTMVEDNGVREGRVVFGEAQLVVTKVAARMGGSRAGSLEAVVVVEQVEVVKKADDVAERLVGSSEAVAQVAYMVVVATAVAQRVVACLAAVVAKGVAEAVKAAKQGGGKVAVKVVAVAEVAMVAADREVVENKVAH
jgi:hypothetical protein